MKKTMPPQGAEKLAQLGYDTASIAMEQLGSLVAVIDAIVTIAKIKAELTEESDWYAIRDIGKLGQECGLNYTESMLEFKEQFHRATEAAKESGK